MNIIIIILLKYYNIFSVSPEFSVSPTIHLNSFNQFDNKVAYSLNDVMMHYMFIRSFTNISDSSLYNDYMIIWLYVKFNWSKYPILDFVD